MLGVIYTRSSRTDDHLKIFVFEFESMVMIYIYIHIK
jgi:hypothetical protein